MQVIMPVETFEPVPLPMEITDMVIDFLFDDKHALKTMSLVCKAFLPSSRLHLFESLTFVTGELGRMKVASTQFDHILPFFVSIAPLVHHLSIVEPEDSLLDTDAGLNEWLIAALPYLAVFQCVTSLSVHFPSWKSIEPDSRKELFTCFRGLSELSMRGGLFSSPAEIAELAVQFPVLERLCFDDIEWEENIRALYIHSVPGGGPTLSRLRSLRLGGEQFDMEPILDWLLRINPALLLHTLCISSISFLELEITGWFVCALRATLKCLKVGFLSYTLLREGVYLSFCTFLALIKDFETESIMEYLDLSQNTELQSLHLESRGTFYDDGTRNGGHIPVLLSLVRSLKEVTITIIDGFEIYPEVWSVLDSIFNQPQFTDLRKLTFYLNGNSVDAAYIRTTLPSCDARGILHIYWTSDQGDYSQSQLSLSTDVVSPRWCACVAINMKALVEFWILDCKEHFVSDQRCHLSLLRSNRRNNGSLS